MPDSDVIEILGNGGSIQNYHHLLNAHVWTANLMQFVAQTTLPFWMDDFRHLAKLDEKEKKSGVIQLLDEAAVRVVSSLWYTEHPYILQYPLKEVVEYFDLGALNRGVWTSTPAYMMAMAIWGIAQDRISVYPDEEYDAFANIFGFTITDVTEIHLHGIDYVETEEYRYHQANAMTFWIGMAEGRGIKVKINPASWLLNTNNDLVEDDNPDRNFYYGYNKKPDVDNWQTIPDFIRKNKNIEQYGFKPRTKDATK